VPLPSRRFLIVPQVAISLGILILTGLLLRSLQRLHQADITTMFWSSGCFPLYRATRTSATSLSTISYLPVSAGFLVCGRPVSPASLSPSRAEEGLGDRRSHQC
jgi:hypothetical protein